jgi:hypothetical protein
MLASIAQGSELVGERAGSTVPQLPNFDNRIHEQFNIRILQYDINNVVVAIIRWVVYRFAPWPTLGDHISVKFNSPISVEKISGQRGKICDLKK